jgi:hypothetical protein
MMMTAWTSMLLAQVAEEEDAAEEQDVEQVEEQPEEEDVDEEPHFPPGLPDNWNGIMPRNASSAAKMDTSNVIAPTGQPQRGGRVATTCS